MAARILLADDHEGVRSAISRLIRRSSSDWEVCGEADNGQSAVDKASALKPDLVVLDLLMPQLDGISGARKIRAALPDTPIVIATLFPSVAVDSLARQAGVQAVVQKSDPHALIPAIRRALENYTADSFLDDHHAIENPPASDSRSAPVCAVPFLLNSRPACHRSPLQPNAAFDAHSGKI
jgi:NarL family two-component system response regulator LiaR